MNGGYLKTSFVAALLATAVGVVTAQDKPSELTREQMEQRLAQMLSGVAFAHGSFDSQFEIRNKESPRLPEEKIHGPACFTVLRVPGESMGMGFGAGFGSVSVDQAVTLQIPARPGEKGPIPLDASKHFYASADDYITEHKTKIEATGLVDTRISDEVRIGCTTDAERITAEKVRINKAIYEGFLNRIDRYTKGEAIRLRTLLDGPAL